MLRFGHLDHNSPSYGLRALAEHVQAWRNRPMQVLCPSLSGVHCLAFSPDDPPHRHTHTLTYIYNVTHTPQLAILRAGKLHRLELIPREWGGRGLLGFAHACTCTSLLAIKKHRHQAPVFMSLMTFSSSSHHMSVCMFHMCHPLCGFLISPFKALCIGGPLVPVRPWVFPNSNHFPY